MPGIPLFFEGACKYPCHYFGGENHDCINQTPGPLEEGPDKTASAVCSPQAQEGTNKTEGPAIFYQDHQGRCDQRFDCGNDLYCMAALAAGMEVWTMIDQLAERLEKTCQLLARQHSSSDTDYSRLIDYYRESATVFTSLQKLCDRLEDRYKYELVFFDPEDYSFKRTEGKDWYRVNQKEVLSVCDG